MINLNRRRIFQLTSMLWCFPASMCSPVRATKITRIVCVGGALTEIIYELGLGKYLVGVDSSSNFPSEVKLLPNVGYARMLSTEGILSMNPSHILFSKNAGPQHIVNFFRNNKNINFYQSKSNESFDGLVGEIKKIANLFDVKDKAAPLIRRLSSEWANLYSMSANSKNTKSSPGVLFILSHRSSEILVGGSGTEADAMIRYAGGTNIAAKLNGYKSFNREVLIQSNPDIVLITEQSKKYLNSLLNNQRVIAIDANQLLGFGPRLPMTIAQLRKDFFA